MIFKFWLWRINIKISKLGGEKKIEFLANELIKAMQESGKQVALPKIADGFGSITVGVHRVGTKDASGYVSYQSSSRSVDFTPNFGELKVFQED